MFKEVPLIRLCINAFLAFVAGCASTETGSPRGSELACIPGATQACLGPGACSGAQLCSANGSGFGACNCGPLGVPGSGGGTGSPVPSGVGGGLNGAGGLSGSGGFNSPTDGTGSAVSGGSASMLPSGGASGAFAACEPAATDPRLIANAEGWISRCTNFAQVQGATYTYASSDSTVTPAPMTPFVTAGDGKLCIKGTGARIIDDDNDGKPEHAKYYGAAMGIDLCATAMDETPPATKFTLGTCPLGTSIKGIRFKITGATFPGEVRVVFTEKGRTESTYVLANEGPNEALFADGKVIFNPIAPGPNLAAIDSIHFMVASNTAAASPFDFCVEELEAIYDSTSAPPPPTPTPTPTPAPGTDVFGTLPTNVSVVEAKQAYDEWKTDYVRMCNGSAYVADPQQSGRAVSEGIGYGMLLAVAHGDKTLFDQLLKFYDDHLNSNGMMKWNIAANCGAAASNSAATDGDLDVAMSLIQASCAFNASYLDRARTSIASIRAAATIVQDGLALLRPGDTFGDKNCLNPSYFSPGYYRAFAQVDSVGAARWSDLARDTYVLFLTNKVAHPVTGLVPNWGNVSGGASSCTNDPNAALYYYDATRTPWRVATDYLWWGIDDAKTLLTRITNWVKQENIALIGDKYSVSGTKLNDFHSPAFVGSLANAAIVDTQITVNNFHQNLKSTRVEEYYPESLRALHLAFGAGLFKRCL